MRTFNVSHFQAAHEMEVLNNQGKAFPVGKVDADSRLQWVATGWDGNVIRIALMLKDRIKVKP